MIMEKKILMFEQAITKGLNYKLNEYLLTHPRLRLRKYNFTLLVLIYDTYIKPQYIWNYMANACGITVDDLKLFALLEKHDKASFPEDKLKLLAKAFNLGHEELIN